MFHRNIDEECSQRTLQSLKNNDSELKCLFSTVAFGMGVRNSKCGACSSLSCAIGKRLEGRKRWKECIRCLLCLWQVIGKNHSRWKDDHYNEVCSTEKDVYPLFGPWKHWDKRIFRKVDKVALAVRNANFEMLHFLHTEIQQGSIRVWDPMMPEFYVKWDS